MSSLAAARAPLRLPLRLSGNSRLIALLVTTGLVAYLVLVPLVMTLLATFTSKGRLPFESGPLTLENYAEVFLSPSTLVLLGNTFVFAVGSLAVGLPLALLLSWLVERTELPGRELLFALTIAPIAIPGLLAAIAWVFLLDPSIGLVNLLLRGALGMGQTRGPFFVYSLAGMVLVEGIRMVPTLFLMLSAAMRSMDPALEEASRAAGKSLARTLWRITLPLMRPALLAATLYYFVVAVEAFEVPGVLGLSAGIYLFSTRIYWAVNPNGGVMSDYGLASTLALILLGISLVLIALYNRATRNARQFVTITGRGFRPQRIHLGKWSIFWWLVCGVYLTLALILPFFILVWTSLHEFYLPPTWEGFRTVSLKAYEAMWNYPGTIASFGNTLLLAASTATVTIALSLMVGWFSVRDRSPLSRLLDNLSFLPQALPGIVVGLAVLLLYLSFPNPIYGTLFIIVIALATHYLAYGSRAVGSGLFQIHPELEEASLVTGVSWWRTWWRITIPLAAPVLLNAWIWVAAHAAREVSTVMLLYTPTSIVISAEIWTMWSNGRAPMAAALGVCLVLLLMVINWGGRLLLGRVRAF